MTEEDSAKAAVEGFIAAFNAQDHEALADTLNYPHVRLANGRIVTVETQEDFVEMSKRGKSHLAAEGWDHTILLGMTVVHSGSDKVHLALNIDRCHADGSIYNQFETFWIATLQDGHWGIQFRSSYLVTPRR